MDSLKELKKELKRIKNGIKTGDITMIVDGNDMIDWGWTTQKLVNKRLKDRGIQKLEF